MTTQETAERNRRLLGFSTNRHLEKLNLKKGVIMHIVRYWIVFLCVFAIASTAAGGNGYMGGSGDFKGGGEDEGGGGGTPIEEPGAESTTGKLYGDLYVILRYLGDEMKKVPAFNENGEPEMVVGDWIDENGEVVICPDGDPCQVLQQGWTEVPAVGGEPRLTEGFAKYTIEDEEGSGNFIINPMTGDIYYPAPYPSQCVQPVADYGRWGDISSKTGIETDDNGDGVNDNLLPLVMTYDATWERTECEVPHDIFIANGETWEGVTYYKDIYYTDLVQEVSFGRLNLGRAPDAVLDAAFDEAITSINKAASMWIDASGRLVLMTRGYDEFLTDEEGNPVDQEGNIIPVEELETVTKAIDSPRENLALYNKLMKDGHLITPAVERTPIDRSVSGGIPLWKYLELEDGPSSALRPTIDVDKVRNFGLGHLVDSANVQTYFTYVDDDGVTLVIEDGCPEGQICEEWYGIKELAEEDVCEGDDFPFSASFLAAAADKTGEFNIDKIVYFNSILGINKVVGYSEYDEDGEPAEDAVDYSKNPVYFDFGAHMNGYERGTTYRQRGQVVTPPGNGSPAVYDGKVRVLVEDQATSGIWVETEQDIFETVFGGEDYPLEGEETSGKDITGFTRMADDDLRVIDYIHTYQIPGLR